MQERYTAEAFAWILRILQEHNIPFQIAGGLAARAYGSLRELADIDLGIPNDRFADILPEIQKYLTYGPARYVDQEWDLDLMVLTYRGQDIDIAGETTIRWFDSIDKTWVTGRCDFSRFEIREVLGQLVPMMPKDMLISHKKRLAREVDLEDVRFLEHA